MQTTTAAVRLWTGSGTEDRPEFVYSRHSMTLYRDGVALNDVLPISEREAEAVVAAATR